MIIRVLAKSRYDFETACKLWNLSQYVDCKYIMTDTMLIGTNDPIVVLPNWNANICIDIHKISEYLNTFANKNSIFYLDLNEQLPESLRK